MGKDWIAFRRVTRGGCGEGGGLLCSFQNIKKCPGFEKNAELYLSMG